MLGDLRQENRALREKLNVLRLETAKPFGEVPALKSSSAVTEKLKFAIEEMSARSGGFAMLSDKAKVVRGEASKRINVLLQDWRDYKEKSESELRRRIRSEQNLKEVLQRKEREIEELTYEVSSYRALVMEQKNTLEVLLEEKEAAEKCKVRCTELERQLNKERRNISELTGELKSKEESIRQSASEKETLVGLNSELRVANSEQKKRLEMCERDVTETSHELEMLEEMVKALQDRKSLFETIQNFQTTVPQSPKILDNVRTTQSTMEQFTPGHHSTPSPSLETSRTHFNSTISDDHSTPKSRIIPRSLENSSITPPVAKLSASRLDSGHAEYREREDSFTAKKSAISALKSLQRDHDRKCNYLADHIKKLKEENNEKEDRLRRLETPPNT